jgi:hypothetical protein
MIRCPICKTEAAELDIVPLAAGFQCSPAWAVSSFQLYVVAFAIFFVLASLNLSLVRSRAEKCDMKPGPFSFGFSRGFQKTSCACSPYFSFAEACSIKQPR